MYTAVCPSLQCFSRSSQRCYTTRQNLTMYLFNTSSRNAILTTEMHGSCSWLHTLMMSVCFSPRPSWLWRQEWSLGCHILVTPLNTNIRGCTRFVYLWGMRAGWELYEGKSLDVVWMCWELEVTIERLLITRMFLIPPSPSPAPQSMIRDLKDNITSYWRSDVIAEVLSPYILKHRITTVCLQPFKLTPRLNFFVGTHIRSRRYIGPSQP